MSNGEIPGQVSKEGDGLLDSGGRNLKHSLEDAEVLAEYAARNNIQNVYAEIDAIAAAREAFSQGRLTAAAQRDFYVAFGSLAGAVVPVTVASLRASLDEYGVIVRKF